MLPAMRQLTTKSPNPLLFLLLPAWSLYHFREKFTIVKHLQKHGLSLCCEMGNYGTYLLGIFYGFFGAFNKPNILFLL